MIVAGGLPALAAIFAVAGCGESSRPGPPPVPPETPDIRLSELMADNEATLADEWGDNDDWIELVNRGAAAASTAGLYLTDDLATPNRWPLPDTTLPAGGVLLVWADDESAEGKWHAVFRLLAAGEEVGLYYGTSLVLTDSTSFGPQRPDTSFARTPSGWVLDPTPTPGRVND
jgi:hypothetical protein